MIHRIEIENFYSVLDTQVIDLRARANVRKQEGLAPLFRDSREYAPKVVALFGANASGKSTILRALSFVSWFVQHSFGFLPPVVDQPPPGIGFQFCRRFFSEKAKNVPTRICLHFSGPEDLLEAVTGESLFCRYAYEIRFESYSEAPRNVLHESLRKWPRNSGKSTRVFERDEKGQVSASKDFGLSGYKNVIDKIRSNASLISTLVQFNHEPSNRLREWASRILSNILIEKFRITDDMAVQRIYSENPAMIDSLNRHIQRIDLGIRAMRIVHTSAGPVAFFDHEGLNQPVPMILESNGTRDFVSIFPILSQSLATGGVAVVDELDQSLHPLILEEIVRWFQSEKRNPHHAQLWMTCQSASLLESLKKEEVVFCQKDHAGRTSVYGLTNVKGVRTVANFRKEYLGGVYGAVPEIG